LLSGYCKLVPLGLEDPDETQPVEADEELANLVDGKAGALAELHERHGNSRLELGE
jgi:hypothetical protein